MGRGWGGGGRGGRGGLVEVAVQEDEPDESGQVGDQADDAERAAFMDTFACTLAAEFGGDNDREHADEVAQHGERKG